MEGRKIRGGMKRGNEKGNAKAAGAKRKRKDIEQKGK